MNAGPEDRREFLAQSSSRVLLRDSDWERIFTEIIRREDAFRRYYPMARVDVSQREAGLIVRALVLNDDLYSDCLASFRAQEESAD
jgi:hypothetical protein